MEKPFYYLSIPFHVSDRWRDLVTDFNIQQHMWLTRETTLLGDETLELINKLGLTVRSGNIWSWLERNDIHHQPWHVDQIDMKVDPVVAFNYLLQGDPGETQWVDFSDVDGVTEITDHGHNVPYIQLRLKDKQTPPRYVASLRSDMPMMINTSIPHRVIRPNQKQTRWAYRIWLLKNGEELRWNEAVEIFKPYFANSSI